MTTDKLLWWEKLPLALATIAQSIIVGLWYYHSIDLGDKYVNAAVAVIAGLALDAIVVTTVMGRRMGRDSKWSNGAAFGAFLCSALIAIDTYSDWLVLVRPLLHVSYPLMVLLYSQHLAGARRSTAPVVESETTAAPLSKTAQAKLLASELGISESTIWRRMKAETNGKQDA